MRFFDVWFFIMLFNLSLGFVSDMGLLNQKISSVPIESQTPSQFFEKEATEVNETISAPLSSRIGLQEVFSFFNQVFQWTLLGVPKLAWMMIKSTILFPIVWQQIGMPTILIALLSPIVYIIQTIGIIQFITGRSLREAQ